MTAGVRINNGGCVSSAMERYVIKIAYETKYIIKVDGDKMILIFRTRRPCFTSPTSKQINLDYAVNLIFNVDLTDFRAYLYISNKIGDDKILAGSRKLDDTETVRKHIESIFNCINLVKENDRKIIKLKRDLKHPKQVHDVELLRKRIHDNKRNRRYNRNGLCKLIVDLFSLGFYRRIPTTMSSTACR